MKVGDLIREREYFEVGLIIGDLAELPELVRPCYAVLTPTGNVEWFGKQYIEDHCEVVSESR